MFQKNTRGVAKIICPSRHRYQHDSTLSVRISAHDMEVLLITVMVRAGRH